MRKIPDDSIKFLALRVQLLDDLFQIELCRVNFTKNLRVIIPELLDVVIDEGLVHLTELFEGVVGGHCQEDGHILLSPLHSLRRTPPDGPLLFRASRYLSRIHELLLPLNLLLRLVPKPLR